MKESANGWLTSFAAVAVDLPQTATNAHNHSLTGKNMSRRCSLMSEETEAETSRTRSLNKVVFMLITFVQPQLRGKSQISSGFEHCRKHLG